MKKDKPKRNHKTIQIYCNAKNMIAFKDKYKREPKPIEISETFFKAVL